jgi:hypothetical protein
MRYFGATPDTTPALNDPAAAVRADYFTPRPVAPESVPIVAWSRVPLNLPPIDTPLLTAGVPSIAGIPVAYLGLGLAAITLLLALRR